MADAKERLAKMAAEAADPADREWAKAKLAALAPAEQEAPPEQPPSQEEPGLLDRIGGQLKKEVGNLTDLPGAYNRLHAAANSFNQNFAFGLPGRVLDMVGATTPEGRAAEAQQYPLPSAAGQVAGLGASAMAGPEAMIG